MLKAANPANEIEAKAAEQLEQLLRRVPSLQLQSVIATPFGGDSGVDLTATVRAAGRDYLLLCEIKSSGQPRLARAAVNQLRASVSKLKRDAFLIFIAPFITASTQELCRAEGVGYLDFEGNAFVSFGPVYIERSTDSRPKAEKREMRSLFRPRSAQVLRILLRDPKRTWKLSELAAESSVSIGHVSNVRDALADREWLEKNVSGLRLNSPDALLDSWRDAYTVPAAEELRLYTPLHGKQWEHALRQFFSKPCEEQAALASFSAAQWIAPYARISTNFLYVTSGGQDALEEALSLSKPAMGENVVLWISHDEGVFTDSFQVDGLLRCTSPLQTYLDLSRSGERGAEAADFLRKAKLAWPN